MGSGINRRDFLNGMALGLAAGTHLSPLDILAAEAPGVAGYPPLATGLRGSHPGAFEVSHALAWSGATWERPSTFTDDEYDLVVVGGGISGLAAAFLFRQRTGEKARILVLDNHDDFGGHAKRNEFVVDGVRLIGYGGSQSIDTPGGYSREARQLLADAGIDTAAFYDYFDQAWFERQKLGRAVYFNRAAYGQDVVAPDVLRGDVADTAAAVAQYPIGEDGRKALARLLAGTEDYLGQRPAEDRLALMRSTSYSDFLRRHAAMPESVVTLLRDTIKGLWGVGWDALSALEAYRLGYPGTAAANLGDVPGDGPARDEPYIFHFPDGNAGVARALVRRLIPDAVPGRTMEDLVTATVDYGRLDTAETPVRIRLEATAVDVRHTPDERAVDVTYVRRGRTERVRGRHAVLACYNRMIPHLCPELPPPQAAAIESVVKVPLVYVSVAVRNWRAFAELGYRGFYLPDSTMMHGFGMDFPVSIGDYRYTENPDRPTVIHGSYVPAAPDQGLTAMEQHVIGRRRVYELTFDDFERSIVGDMSAALAAGGFDPERDIAAITVNRWPHGYAYEYNDYSDPPEWDRWHGPHLAGAARLGRISIANSDAAGYAYVDGAIDAAVRAVREQTGV